MTSTLLRFYAGGATDDRGRLLAEILRQDDDWLEVTHDFIQWLFPLAERSGANPDAPRVDNAIREAFRGDPLLRQHLRASLLRMLAFLGLQLRADGQVVPSAAWPGRKTAWFTHDGHNSLRVTRMIRSLDLLGLAAEAKALQAGVLRLCREDPDCGIGEHAQGFWRAALPGGDATP
jgi:hypothetical protein